MIKNVKKNIKIPKSANTERLNGIKIAPFITKINRKKSKKWHINRFGLYKLHKIYGRYRRRINQRN